MDRKRFYAGALTILALMHAPATLRAEVPVAKAAAMDNATAVNLAGRQRMLSQRSVKAYLMLGQGIADGDPRKLLQESITQFDVQLSTLKTYQPTPAVRNALSALEDAWLKCKPMLTGVPDRTTAAALYDANEELQKAAHSATVAYETASLVPLDHLVGIAGRQRMLSQRMAKFYFYRTWNLYDAAADMELHLSSAHFSAVLNAVENSPLVSAEVRAGVARVRREWEPYRQVLFANREPENMRKDAPRVAELSERMLAATENLVTLMAAQARVVPRQTN
ncbi:MAG: hypothetical protein BGP21_06670 [Thiobacillus sp. 65-29]|nr:MAG: hypothetical protein BGP21_06670 [Thiobacillus sp. 65-29]